MATFSNQNYQTDRGSVFLTKIEDLAGVDAVTGEEPAGTLTEDMTCRIGRTSRESGIRPRFVTLKRGIGAAVTDPDPEIPGRALVNSGASYRRVAVLTQAHYNTINKGDNFTIEGTVYEVSGKTGEDVK